MDVFLRLLNGLLMLAMPLALGVYLARRMGQRWGLYLVGMLTFFASQLLHLPFNLLLLNPRLELGQGEPTLGFAVSAALLGLSAGVFEESARYLVLRFWQRKARSWREALMFGAGHGGLEAIILGVIVLVTLAQMIAYRGADLGGIVPADQLELAQQQVSAYWTAPSSQALLGALERLFALCLHLSLSVMVMRAFTHTNRWWVLAAIGWHALVDAAAVFSLPQLGAVATEALIGVFALLSVLIVIRLREEPEAPAADSGEPVRAASAPPERIEPSTESIDRSRYADP